MEIDFGKSFLKFHSLSHVLHTLYHANCLMMIYLISLDINKDIVIEIDDFLDDFVDVTDESIGADDIKSDNNTNVDSKGKKAFHMYLQCLGYLSKISYFKRQILLCHRKQRQRDHNINREIPCTKDSCT